MNHLAVYALYPNVVNIIVDKAFDANGNEVALDMNTINNWVNPEQYKYDREGAYPKLEEQLDMLWHAIDSGTLDQTSDFYTTLKAVKDNNPKPTE